MWIPKITFETLRSALLRAQVEVANREQDIMNLDGRLLVAQEEQNRLRERLIQAEGAAKSHQAYADVWRLQVNQLTETNAALLTQLVPSLTLKVPKVERESSLMPSGLDFEDMGDAAAALMGLADEHPLEPGPPPPLGSIPVGVIVSGTPRVPE